MLQGAIFDLDGTLLDSMYIWNTLGADYLRSIGYEPRGDLNEAIRSLSLHQAARYFQEEYRVGLVEDVIVDGINSMIKRYYDLEINAKQGAAAFLESLECKGVRMCIATATHKHLAKAALDRLGLMKYFSEIITVSSVGFGKDKPDIYRTALAHLGTDKKRTVVFEDAVHALCTAKDDGFATVAVYDDSEPNQAEACALSDYYISDYTTAASFWKFASKL